MKLSKTALLEIVDIVREGLMQGTDISERLRKLDFVVMGPEDSDTDDRLELSEDYLLEYPRAENWKEVN